MRGCMIICDESYDDEGCCFEEDPENYYKIKNQFLHVVTTHDTGNDSVMVCEEMGKCLFPEDYSEEKKFLLHATMKTYHSNSTALCGPNIYHSHQIKEKNVLTYELNVVSCEYNSKYDLYEGYMFFKNAKAPANDDVDKKKYFKFRDFNF